MNPRDFIRFPYSQRFKHFYIPGGTGTGKTTQLLIFAVQDIAHNCGFTVIDPKGDFVNLLLDYIPQHRVEDTIYLDLETPTPFDFLAFRGETEKDEMVEDIIYLLLHDAGNAPRAKMILTDVLYTMLSSREPVAFLDIARFLLETEKGGRHDTILAGIDDPELKAIWKKGLPRDEKLEPILSRFNKYRRNSVLKKVFGTPNPPLNIEWVMDNRKILLVNLGGASRAALDYGSLLFMKMKQEVFRRHKKKVYERIPHFLFVDEFQKFAHVDGFKDVLEMARSYKLAMTLANPSYYDLPSNIQSGIGICGAYICFRLDPKDIPFFKHFYGGEDADILSHLDDHEAYYKIKGRPGRLKPEPTPPRKPPISYKDAIIRNMAKYRPTAAEIRLIRNPHPTPLHSTPIPHDKGDDSEDDNIWGPET